MKKSLLALAALSAIAGTAQAQSSVTLFGTLDAGGYYASGLTNKTNSAFGVVGNTIASSNWGLKGTEDLGGGLKANFYLESGIQPRNGALSQAAGEFGVYSAGVATSAAQTTLFDRGATVGVSGNWGSLDIGNKMNPMYGSSAGLNPVSGNSVFTATASALGYSGSTFTHNALTYTLPTISGFNAQLQWGAGNAVSDQVNGSMAGTVIAASTDYTNGGFNVRAAFQKRYGNGTNIAANQSANTQVTYLAGAKYNTGAFTVGAGFISNDVNPGSGIAITTNNNYVNNAFTAGVGYQATPAVLLGLNWVGATSGANLINAQARYAFSKRTQAYGQLGYAINKTGLNGSGAGNFYALSGSSGAAWGTGAAATYAPTWNQLAIGAGLIHTF